MNMNRSLLASLSSAGSTAAPLSRIPHPLLKDCPYNVNVLNTNGHVQGAISKVTTTTAESPVLSASGTSTPTPPRPAGWKSSADLLLDDEEEEGNSSSVGSAGGSPPPSITVKKSMFDRNPATNRVSTASTPGVPGTTVEPVSPNNKHFSTAPSSRVSSSPILPADAPPQTAGHPANVGGYYERALAMEGRVLPEEPATAESPPSNTRASPHLTGIATPSLQSEDSASPPNHSGAAVADAGHSETTPYPAGAGSVHPQHMQQHYLQQQQQQQHPHHHRHSPVNGAPLHPQHPGHPGKHPQHRPVGASPSMGSDRSSVGPPPMYRSAASQQQQQLAAIDAEAAFQEQQQRLAERQYYQEQHRAAAAADHLRRQEVVRVTAHFQEEEMRRVRADRIRAAQEEGRRAHAERQMAAAQHQAHGRGEWGADLGSALPDASAAHAAHVQDRDRVRLALAKAESEAHAHALQQQQVGGHPHHGAPAGAPSGNPRHLEQQRRSHQHRQASLRQRYEAAERDEHAAYNKHYYQHPGYGGAHPHHQQPNHPYATTSAQSEQAARLYDEQIAAERYHAAQAQAQAQAAHYHEQQRYRQHPSAYHHTPPPQSQYPGYSGDLPGYHPQAHHY